MSTTLLDRAVGPGLALAAALALLLAAPAARAHNETYPIPGDSVLIDTTAPASAAFEFQAEGGSVPLIDHDPSVDGSGVLVRGLGPNAGRTPLISLDRNLWQPHESGEGYRYTDVTGSRGGVTSVVMRPGEVNIQASGPAWPWSPSGSQDHVWVHFQIGDTGYCAGFDGSSASSNAANLFQASGAAAPVACPSQVCGDAVPQPGEQCDDGNLATGDGCDPTCEVGSCNAQSYDSTFAAIQDVVLEGGYGCTLSACHDSFEPKNDLDLTSSAAWEKLMGPDGLGRASHDYPTLKLVEPGEPDQSYLYIKLAAKTFPNQSFVVNPGVAMPSSAQVALTEDHLEGVWRWIRGGAPQDGVVEGTQALLGTCLPPPTPLKIPVPPAPPAGMGIQLKQTPWPLPPTTPQEPGEDEVCMATYYDFSTVVPEEARIDCPAGLQPRSFCVNSPQQTCTTSADCPQQGACVTQNVNNPSGQCFRYHRQVLYQDPQSHHSIIHLYTGTGTPSHAGWGAWTYKLEPGDPEAAKDGDPCEPMDVDPTGQNRGCSGAVVTSIACVGYGPPDASQAGNLTGGGGGNLPNFSGSQEPFYEAEFADGVYATLPISGIVVWNSHAFNLTPTPSTMAQYLNLDLAQQADQQYPVQGIFMSSWIFAQNAPPFGQQEICGTYTIPQGSNLFNLTSHTHLRGVRWRTWGPPNTPCQPGCPVPYNPSAPFAPCTPNPGLPLCSDLGYPRSDPPLYFSTDYSDPLQLNFDPPRHFADPDVEDRTFLFCSLYDNGSDPQGGSPPVKRRSTTPMPPSLPGLPGIPFPIPGETLNSFGLGGPCPVTQTYCVDGPSKGQFCGGDHSLCGDPANEWCDACYIRGGVTTQDEMFILIGSYYIPEPEASLLGAAALATLAGLARRRRA